VITAEPHTRRCLRCDWTGTADTWGEARDLAVDHAVAAEHWLCALCLRSLPAELEQTCYGCVARTKTRLADIVDLYALLPAELTDGQGHILSADRPQHDPIRVDVLAMLGPGSAGTAWPRRHWPVPLDLGYDETYNSPPLRSPQHGMNLPSDPVSVAAQLGSWEDDWRTHRAEPAASQSATVAGAANYLMARLGQAAQDHPAFADFADELRDMHRALEAATARGDRFEHSDAPCFDCGQRDLTRSFRPPDPCDHQPAAYGSWHRLLQAQWREQHQCDQGGLDETVWVCRTCGREYVPRDYWLAVTAYYETRAAMRAEAQA
jgi:hypothetical protein